MKRLALVFLAAAAVAAGATAWRRFTRAPGAGVTVPAVPPGTVMVAMPCYYPSRRGLELIEEIRQRPKAATPQERLRAVIEELHRPPADAAALPVFPAVTAPRAVFLSAEGLACIDETAAALESPAGPRDEFLQLRAIARSVLRTCPEARALVILADGAPRQRLALHLSLAGRYLLPRQVARPR